MEWFLFVSLLLLGYIVGLLQHGIKINITQKHEHKYEQPEAPHHLVPEQEMESTEEMLPQEMQDYAKKHQGLINF